MGGKGQKKSIGKSKVRVGKLKINKETVKDLSESGLKKVQGGVGCRGSKPISDPDVARLDPANSQDVKFGHFRWAQKRSVPHFYGLLLFVHSKWMLEVESLRCCHGVPFSPKGIHSSAQGCGEAATLGNQKPPLRLHP